MSTLCPAHVQRQDSTAALLNVCHFPIMVFLSHAEGWKYYAKCPAPSDTLGFLKRAVEDTAERHKEMAHHIDSEGSVRC